MRKFLHILGQIIKWTFAILFIILGMVIIPDGGLNIISGIIFFDMAVVIAPIYVKDEALNKVLKGQWTTMKYPFLIVEFFVAMFLSV